MNRRTFLLTVLSVSLLSTTAARADYADDVVKWLLDEGYTDIEVTRTLLGRVRILSRLGSGQRELIINPRTGEILRDVWIAADGTIQPFHGSKPGERDDDNGGHGGDDNSGHGSGDDGEDDDNSGHGGGDDDEKDDDKEDDKSGHGGGGDDDD